METQDLWEFRQCRTEECNSASYKCWIRFVRQNFIVTVMDSDQIGHQKRRWPAAIKMIQKTGLHYVVDIDIKGFFYNVNHTKLIKQIWDLGITDKKLICIIKAMLKVPIILENGDKIMPNKGTSQGGILSPLLSNMDLNELDW